MESFPARETRIGDLVVFRALPIRERRMVGPWCFLDRYGPLTFSAGRPMDVAPHPHIGLQTVTWLLDGEVEHDDSLGNQSLLRPDGVNVMTSGGGIAHAEQTPRDHSGRLNGVQLWTALPNGIREGAAGFAHVDRVPAIESRGGIARVFAGALGGTASPAPYFSPIVGADLLIHAGHTLTLPLDPAFEHAVLVLDGDAALDGEPLAPRMLHYLGLARSHADFVSGTGGRVLLIGGAPFEEKILMWWNFVARTPEEIAAAHADWESHQRFGEVRHYRGDRLEAPKLVQAARPTPMS